MSVTKEAGHKIVTNSLTDEDYEAIFQAVLAVDDFEAILDYEATKLSEHFYEEAISAPNDADHQEERAELNVGPVDDDSGEHDDEHCEEDIAEDAVGDDGDDRMEHMVLDELPADVSAEIAQLMNESTPCVSDAEVEYEDHHIPIAAPPKVKHRKHATYKQHKVVPRRLDFPKHTERHVLKDITNERKNEMHKHRQQKRKRSAKKHRKLMQQRHVEELGTWVQCTSSVCSKWRYLADLHDPTTIPQYWTCCMNQDENYNSCSIAQVDFDQAEHDVAYTFVNFTEGSVVWAKMGGFPWWPALVEIDPDTREYVECRYTHTTASHYHVVFLDENVSRAWISKDNLQPLTCEPDIQQFAPWTFSGVNYKKRVLQAWNEAQVALQLTLQDRLQAYGFSQKYKGKWTAEMSSSQEYADCPEEKILYDDEPHAAVEPEEWVPPSAGELNGEDEDWEQQEGGKTMGEDGGMMTEREEEEGNKGEECNEEEEIRRHGDSINGDTYELEEKITKKKAKKEKKLKRKNEDDTQSGHVLPKKPKMKKAEKAENKKMDGNQKDTQSGHVLPKKPKMKKAEKAENKKMDGNQKGDVGAGCKSLGISKHKPLKKDKPANQQTATTTKVPQFAVKVKPSFKAPAMNTGNEKGEEARATASKSKMESLNSDVSNESANVPLFSQKTSKTIKLPLTKGHESKTTKDKPATSSGEKCVTLSAHKMKSTTIDCTAKSTAKTKSISKDGKAKCMFSAHKVKNLCNDDNSTTVTSDDKPASITGNSNALSAKRTTPTAEIKPTTYSEGTAIVTDNSITKIVASKPKGSAKKDNAKSSVGADRPKMTKDNATKKLKLKNDNQENISHGVASDSGDMKPKGIAKVKSKFVAPQIGQKKTAKDDKKPPKKTISKAKEDINKAIDTNTEKVQTSMEKFVTATKGHDRVCSEKAKPMERDHEDDDELNLDEFIEPNGANLEKWADEIEASNSQPFDIDDGDLLNDTPIVKLADISDIVTNNGYNSDPLDLEE